MLDILNQDFMRPLYPNFSFFFCIKVLIYDWYILVKAVSSKVNKSPLGEY